MSRRGRARVRRYASSAEADRHDLEFWAQRASFIRNKRALGRRNGIAPSPLLRHRRLDLHKVAAEVAVVAADAQADVAGELDRVIDPWIEIAAAVVVVHV